MAPGILTPPRVPVIALYSPAAQSGKSEVAKLLQRRLGFLPVKFASGLKNMVRSFLRDHGIDAHTIERMVEGDLKEVPIPGLGVTPRHLMETLGTDWGREKVKPTVWVELTSSRIKQLVEEGRRVVVDDMRQPNEMAAIEAIGGLCVRVVRPGVQATSREGLLDGYEFLDTIANDRDLATLDRKVGAFAWDFLRRLEA